MKSVALLPSVGDPLLAAYWVRNYEQTWKGEVDELVVLVNGRDPWKAGEIFQSTGARVFVEDYRLGHGEALRYLMDRTSADVVMFIEEDAFVRERGAIAARVARAWAGEVIGSPRGGMSPELEVAAREKWGDVTGPDGSSGHGLWPCFFFCRSDVLAQTDCRFESRNWVDGERIRGLDFYVHPGPLHTDTMTSVAFQLRAQNPISLEGQWKEVHLKDFPGSAPWFHAGGLSTFDEYIPEGLTGSNSGRDFAHRLWWWERTSGEDEGRQLMVMEKALRAGLVPDMMNWDHIIEPWINWDDGVKFAVRT